MTMSPSKRAGAVAFAAAIAFGACSGSGAPQSPSAPAGGSAAASSSGTASGGASAPAVTGTISVSGSSTVEPISTGVAEALIATMCGLFIAVTCLLPYNYLNARTEEAKHEIADASNALELIIKKSETTAPFGR